MSHSFIELSTIKLASEIGHQVAFSAQMLPKFSSIVEEPFLPSEGSSKGILERLLELKLNRPAIFDSEVFKFVGDFAQISSYFFNWQFANQFEIVLNLKGLLNIQITFTKENLSQERDFSHRLINCEVVVDNLLYGGRLTFVDQVSAFE